jgi:hypothetical protein
MTDPRLALGLEVEESVCGPYKVVAAARTSPDDGGTLDCGIVAHTKDGRQLVIGEIWAAGVGPGGSKVRLDARKIAEDIVAMLAAK